MAHLEGLLEDSNVQESQCRPHGPGKPFWFHLRLQEATAELEAEVTRADLQTE